MIIHSVVAGAHLRVPAEEREGVQAPVEMLRRTPLFLQVTLKMLLLLCCGVLCCCYYCCCGCHVPLSQAPVEMLRRAPLFL